MPELRNGHKPVERRRGANTENETVCVPKNRLVFFMVLFLIVDPRRNRL